MWSHDLSMEALFWGAFNCLLAAVLSLLGFLPFWLALISGWSLSIAVCLHLSSQKLSPEGRAVLITGTDSGIGHSAALRLHELGFMVFAGCLEADNRGKGAQALRQLDSDRLHVIQLDITKQEQIDNALQEVKKLLPEGEGLWAVVNNAAVSAFGEAEWVSMDTYKRIAEVNIFGLIAVTKAFLPLVRKARGRVINIASVLCRFGRGALSPYIITKYAVEGFTECLRQEMKAWDVAVSLIEPGNYSAGTQMTTEESIQKQGLDMWKTMSEEVKDDYGQDYFDMVVHYVKLHSNSGLSDITPVVEAIRDAVTQRFPRTRYQPNNAYYILKVFVATHLPGWIFHFFYIGSMSKRRR